MNKKDLFDKAKSADIVRVLSGELVIKKKGPRYVALCPFHDDKQESLQVGSTGKSANKYHCYACGAHGSAIDFFVNRDGKTKAQAAEIVCKLAGEYIEKPFENAVERHKTAQNDTQQILPPAGSTPNNFKKKFERFGGQILEASKVWEYRTALGQLWGYVARFDLPDGSKETLPRTYRSNNRWQWLGFDDPRPLYNLAALRRSQNKTLLLVEGEKTADAAIKAVGGVWDVATWQGGTNGVSKAEFSICQKYETVYIWPDNDAAGMSAALHIAHLLKYRRLQNECYVVPLDYDKEKGWDVADQDWQPGELVAQVEERAKSASKTSRTVKEVGKDIVYILGPDNGRWTMKKQDQKPEQTPAPVEAQAPAQDKKAFGSTYDFDKFKDLIEKGEPGWSEFLAEQLAQRFRFDVNANVWRVYADGVWRHDLTLEHEKTSIKVLQIAVNDFIRYCIAKEHEAEAANEDGGGWARKAKDLARFKIQVVLKNSGIRSIIAGAGKYCPVMAKDLDKDPLKFNCSNGTLDLSTGEFYSHRAADLLSKRSPVAYKKGGNPDKWLKFLNLIFEGDKDLIRFMQKFAGYTLTGLTDVQGVFFAFGHGANGKSVFFNVIRMMMGEYAVSVPNETFLSKRDPSQTDYNTATLEGARLAIATELPQRRTFDMAKLKDITGGEPVTIRRPYEKPYPIQVLAKILFSGNHKPNLGDTSDGAKRRLYMLPFNYRFPEDQRREMSVVMTEFEAELPEILSWAVEGFKMYQVEGLKRPQAILQANAEYLEEQDNFRPFFDAHYQPGVSSDGKAVYIPLRTVYDAYREWIGDDPATLKSVRELSAHLTREFGPQVIVKRSGQSCLTGFCYLVEMSKNENKPASDYLEPLQEATF